MGNQIPEHRKAFWKFEDVHKCAGNQYVQYYAHTFNQLLPLHSHDFFEINMIVGGYGTHYIRGRELLTGKGDIFIIPPNIPHGYACKNQMTVYHILLSNRFIAEYGSLLGRLPGYRFLFHIEPLLRSSMDKPFYLKSESISIETVQRYIALIESNDSKDAESGSICHILSLIAEMSRKMHRLCGDTRSDLPDKKVYSLIESIEYIDHHCVEKMDYRTLADQCAVSYSTYWRLFKKLTGITPMEYQISCKIKMAEVLLQSTDDSILSVALTCGFYDSSHFIREFVKRKQMTPTEFRKAPV